ncbi:MAG TPA: hypothetical protein P5150_03760, partial [Candidatus Ratteibacteria bacterium]|nr:hypothetical protein [Candidatus Ratteibacteria bacterium]
IFLDLNFRWNFKVNPHPQPLSQRERGVSISPTTPHLNNMPARIVKTQLLLKKRCGRFFQENNFVD